jgi:hypothetical protein
MEFMQSPDGEILLKNNNDNQWFKIDEDGFSLADIGDVVVDIGQGVAEGVGGGLAGLATMNPFIGAGTAAAIGGTTEAIKQGVGSLAGIPNNYDGGNLAASTAISGVMPGVGKTVKAGWQGFKNKVAPAAGEWLSGIPRQVLSSINADDQARKEIASGGVTNFVNTTRDNLVDGMENALNTAGKRVGAATHGQGVDIRGLKSEVDTIFNQLTDEQKVGWGYLRDKLVNVDDVVDPAKATELKNHFYLLSRNDKSPLGRGALDAATNDLSKGEMRIASKVSTGVRDSMRSAAPDKHEFDLAYKGYSDAASTLTDDKLNPFKKADTTMKFMESFGKKKTPLSEAYRDEFFGKVKDMSGVDVPLAARQYQSAQYFNDPSKLPIGWGSAGKGASIGGALGGALGYYGAGGAAAGIALGQGGAIAGGMMTSPWAMKQMGQAAPRIDRMGNKAARYIYENPYFRPDKAIYNLQDE